MFPSSYLFKALMLLGMLATLSSARITSSGNLDSVLTTTAFIKINTSSPEISIGSTGPTKTKTCETVEKDGTTYVTTTKITKTPNATIKSTIKLPSPRSTEAQEIENLTRTRSQEIEKDYNRAAHVLLMEKVHDSLHGGEEDDENVVDEEKKDGSTTNDFRKPIRTKREAALSMGEKIAEDLKALNVDMSHENVQRCLDHHAFLEHEEQQMPKQETFEMTEFRAVTFVTEWEAEQAKVTDKDVSNSDSTIKKVQPLLIGRMRGRSDLSEISNHPLAKLIGHRVKAVPGAGPGIFTHFDGRPAVVTGVTFPNVFSGVYVTNHRGYETGWLADQFEVGEKVSAEEFKDIIKLRDVRFTASRNPSKKQSLNLFEKMAKFLQIEKEDIDPKEDNSETEEKTSLIGRTTGNKENEPADVKVGNMLSVEEPERFVPDDEVDRILNFDKAAKVERIPILEEERRGKSVWRSTLAGLKGKNTMMLLGIIVLLLAFFLSEAVWLQYWRLVVLQAGGWRI